MRPLRRVRAGMLLLLVACSAPVYGHHSFAGIYLEGESITIEGEVVEFAYRAPHSWLYVMVPDRSGTRQRYAAEWLSTTQLKRDGVLKDTFQVGDRIIITGSPARIRAARQIHLKFLKRVSRGEFVWRERSRGQRPPAATSGRAPS